MATETVTVSSPSFASRRAVLVRTDDAHCASFWDESQVDVGQADDGPTHLIVGGHAGDDALARMASQFSIGFGELQAFRDNAEPVPSDLRERFTPKEATAFQLLRRCREPRPSARNVVEAWLIDRPPEVAKVLPDGIDYYDAKGDTKFADLDAIRKAIGRMTSAR